MKPARIKLNICRIAFGEDVEYIYGEIREDVDFFGTGMLFCSQLTKKEGGNAQFLEKGSMFLQWTCLAERMDRGKNWGKFFLTGAKM